MRISWDKYFLGITFIVSKRSTCLRRSVGAIIVKNKRIKSTGYNGSPIRLPHCIDGGCNLINKHCLRCIHAEVNALLECSPQDRVEATLYCTDYPCPECQKLIINSGIIKIVYARFYKTYIDWFCAVPEIEIIKMDIEKC